MLEQQQRQLVAGIQELYKRTQSGLGWTGPSLKDTQDGNPLTHDILYALGALEQGDRNRENESEQYLNMTRQGQATHEVSLQQQELCKPHLDNHQSSVYETVTTTTTNLIDHLALHQFPVSSQNKSSYPHRSPTPGQTAAQSHIPSYSMHVHIDSGVMKSPSWVRALHGLDDDVNSLTASESLPFSKDTVPQFDPQTMLLRAGNIFLATAWNDEIFVTPLDDPLLA